MSIVMRKLSLGIVAQKRELIKIQSGIFELAKSAVRTNRPLNTVWWHVR